MDTITRERYNGLVKGLAAHYGVTSATEAFAVTEPKALELINAVQQSVEFLNRVSVIPVTDTTGAIVMLNIPNPLAGRTDTTGSGERKPQSVTDMTERTYLVAQIDYDYNLTYNQLDIWARFPDFATRVANMVNRRKALDMLLIGFNGTSRAATTDRVANPLLQDVSQGWIFDLKTNNPANYLSPGTISFGASGDYKNLDQAANDLLSAIPREHRTGNERVIIGEELLAWEVDILFEITGHKPTEKQALQVLKKGAAGMPMEVVPGFPTKGMMVTDPANLQIYLQTKSVRKQYADNPKKNCVEHYHSENSDWKIGDIKAIAALDADQVTLD